MQIQSQINERNLKISVIGLGYVGLPIALAFARKVPVIGFDIKAERIELLKKKIDPNRELSQFDFDGCDIDFTSNPEDIKHANFHIVSVPTPVNTHNQPDLSMLINASEILGKVLKKDDIVVYESTVYPGATEEDCVPVLEKFSGLKYMQDFKVGYSPERINPGDKEHSVESVVKVVAGCDSETLETIAKIYEMIVKADVYRASSIKVAEAAKIIENTQRDVNIALINELSIIFGRMGINTYEVLDAAKTKWNFLNFQPGLVGGHCISVDPYYLSYKAHEFDYHPQIILSGRFVNEAMSFYVAEQLVKKLTEIGKNILQCKVLIMGITFKENVSDIRNSKVADIVKELNAYRIYVDVYDKHACAEEVMQEFGFSTIEKPSDDYDAVLVAVKHDEFLSLSEKDFLNMMKADGKQILFDIKGIYRGKIKNLNYWSL